jgi:hypothetical protein
LKRVKARDGAMDRVKEAERLAEEHWKFLEEWLHKMFHDAFVHGFKHGQENKKDEK